MQIKFPEFTAPMCDMISQEVSSDQRILLNCIFKSRGDDLYRQFKRLTKPESKIVLLCKAKNEHLFAGYMPTPMEPNNPKNVIFSLTNQTVHRFKMMSNESTDNILQNLEAYSEYQSKYSKRKKLILRFGEQDLVIYQNKRNKLICKSILGQMYRKTHPNGFDLGGKRKFELEKFWLFEVI